MGMISLAALALPIAAIAWVSYYLLRLANRIEASSQASGTLDRASSRSLHDAMRNHESYLVMSAFVPIFVTLLTTHGTIAESLFWVLVAFVVVFTANSLCRGVLRRRLEAQRGRHRLGSHQKGRSFWHRSRVCTGQGLAAKENQAVARSG